MEWDSDDIMDRSASASPFAGGLSIDSSFERFLFSLLPALVLILLSPFYVRHYRLEPIRVRNGLVLWTKLAFAAGLAIVEFSNFRLLRSELGRQTGGSVLVPSVSFIAALSIAFVIEAEHRRALRSSALTGVYLLITLLYDVARAKSHYFYLSQTLASLAVAGVVLKLCLLLLLEVSKRDLITDPQVQESAGEEAVSGFWSRSFLLWLHSTLFLGFHSILSVDDLGPLDPEFSSQALSARLQLSLQTTNPSRFWLMKGFMRTFHADIFLTVIPRLFLMGFTFYQPLFLQRVITYIAEESSSKLTCLSLVGQSALIFFGIAASRSIYNHMNTRQVTILRGALVPLVIGKTLNQPKYMADDSSTTNLVTSDVEGITAHLTGLHELWAQSAEICLGLYLLSTIETEAAHAVFYIIVAAAVLTFCAGTAYSHYFVIWNERVERRVSQTTKFLSQIKSIKMVGIETAIATRLQRLRISEITAHRAVRLTASLMNLISMSGFALMPVAAIAKAFFGVSFARAFLPAGAYTTLAIVTLTGYPLSQVLIKHTSFRSSMASTNRVQKHLISQERTLSDSNAGRPTMPLGSLGPALEPQTAGRIFEFNGAYLAPSQVAEPVLRNVSCSVDQSQITAIVGPVASGKTTLIRAMLGEAATRDGIVLRKDCKIAYCGQKPWLRNTSIRSNIIGPAPFDPVRYEVALNASALGHDLQHLPARDLTVIGSNGMNLSGGQRHRVALARALYSRAPILLLDDIFSGLDASTAEDVHNRLFGPKGVVRKSNLTVVFTTHSASFMKVAHQALILNSTGTVTVQSEPSRISLSEDFAAQPSPSNQSSVSTTGQTSTEATSARDIPDFASSNNVRQRGAWNLYGYFLSPTSLWKIVLGILGALIAVASEYLGGIFVRHWLETEEPNEDYLVVYASTAVMCCLVTFGSLCYAFLVVAPQNSLKIHKNLLDSVTKAKLSHLTGADISSVLNHFGQDLKILTDFVPKMLYSFLYGAAHIFFSACFVLSGMRYSALAVPFLFIVLHTIPTYSLRTARQMTHLNSEAAEPLYKLTNEIESGLEHIRGFGWQAQISAECIEALDHSQKPFYYKLAVQRWVELAMDISTLGLVLILVSIAAATKDTVSQTATGFSLLQMSTFNLKLHHAVAAFVRLETFLACVARMRSFIHSMPAEDGDAPVSLPPRWPTIGNIELSNVTVQYTPTSSMPILNDVSLTIRGGQKVGISGRTGSGKTSMLLTLLRLTEYTGTIVIDGIDISTIPSQQLRSCITTVSQDTIKIDGTVRENLLPYEGQLQDKTITEDILFEALDQTELTNIVERRGGLEAQLSTMEFSDGQMQLLSLARAIVHHTCTQSRLVLLDEPTSHLDVETDNRIQASLRDAFLDCTIILVSHRAESLWDSNVRFEVKNKRVARFFTPKPSPKPLPFHTMLYR